MGYIQQIQSFNEKCLTGTQNLFKKKVVKYVQWVIIAVVVFLVVWDIYLYNSDNHKTISTVIYENTIEDHMFVIPWVWGVLAGHLFLNIKDDANKIPEVIAIILLVLLSVLFFFLGRFVTIELSIEMHLGVLLVGMACGHYLWPQKVEPHLPLIP